MRSISLKCNENISAQVDRLETCWIAKHRRECLERENKTAAREGFPARKGWRNLTDVCERESESVEENVRMSQLSCFCFERSGFAF